MSLSALCHLAACWRLDIEWMRGHSETSIARMCSDFLAELTEPQQMVYDIMDLFEGLRQGTSMLYCLSCYCALLLMHCEAGTDEGLL